MFVTYYPPIIDHPWGSPLVLCGNSPPLPQGKRTTKGFITILIHHFKDQEASLFKNVEYNKKR
jgi:hypothetical protein